MYCGPPYFVANRQKIREKYTDHIFIKICFNLYLSNLVYWVGFVPAMRSSTLLKILIFVDFRDFWPLSLKLLFFGNSAFFRTLRLALISAKPYYQNARIDRGVIFGFRRNLRNYCKLPVRSGFLGVSLISVFSLYFINFLYPADPHTRPG